MEISDFKCVSEYSFEENEFNSTVLWLRVTLLSISHSPLIFVFVFRL